MENIIYIFKSNGFYFGFIKNDFLFSRNGIYLGWIERNFVWDRNGRFRGVIRDINGEKYILINRFTILPVSRTPKTAPPTEIPPPPKNNILPITLSPELIDAFNGD